MPTTGRRGCSYDAHHSNAIPTPMMTAATCYAAGYAACAPDADKSDIVIANAEQMSRSLKICDVRMHNVRAL